jgi:DeoR/GlpR family transcriptional regulator of sugar metabolism
VKLWVRCAIQFTVALRILCRRLQIRNDLSEMSIQILVMCGSVLQSSAAVTQENEMSRPLAVQRQNEILRRLSAAGSVGVGELAEAFGVSHETIRRDLKALAEIGELDLVHGGAARRSVAASVVLPAENDHCEAREAIGRAAAALVGDGATILIDSCPTATALVRELVGRTGLTVCTNSLRHALLLSHKPGCRVFMLGGEVDSTSDGVFGTDALAGIGHFRVDIAFIGVGGFAEDGGPTDTSREAAELRGRMVLAGRAFFVADHSQFEQRTPYRIPYFAQAAGLIVDRAPPAALATAWSTSGLQAVIAQSFGAVC